MKTRQLRSRLPQEQKNKSSIPAIIISFFCWLTIAILILFIDPQTAGAVPGLFATFFIALFLTLAVLLKNKKRGLIYSLAVVLFAFLSYFGMGNILNLILIAGIVISIEIFVSPKQN